MVHYTNFEMFYVVGDVSEYWDAHDEEVKLDIFDLPLELLDWSSFQNILDFLLFFCLFW